MQNLIYCATINWGVPNITLSYLYAMFQSHTNPHVTGCNAYISTQFLILYTSPGVGKNKSLTVRDEALPMGKCMINTTGN